ncbi:MAG: hypothetical protein H7Z13_07050 [Ferruginibacter sp.]|nr:hypothetical protein [Ferruginibacter sp.]
MLKQVSLVVWLILVAFFFNTIYLFAQEVPLPKDTFFLSKKRGLLGRLGKSVSVDIPGPEPVKTANPYLVHTGKSIRFIAILSLGFERNIYDTNRVKNTIGVVIANAFHKNTRDKIILNNLFFREGSKINPYLVADNERHLRNQVYIQDSRILVVSVPGSTDLVDVIVITKDVFSIGGNISISGVERAKIGIREENFGGSGSKIAVSTFYEKDRHPNLGYGVEMIKRNVKGSFIDWSIGFQTYKSAFSSNRSQESFVYTHFEKPLVSLYIPWIGAADLSFSKTRNAYPKDSLYQSHYKYSYYNADAWFGYNFGSKKLLYGNIIKPLRKFVAIRGFSQRFNQLPQRNLFDYDYRYANISGVLMAFSIFKQDFYRTNFIYGFGRNEDVPEGFSASAIGGWTDKDKRSRAYYGLEAQRSHFNNKGFYSSYTLRFGTFSFKKRLEDIDLLLGVDHFTRLKKMGSKWQNRNFYGASFTKQVRPVSNQPLFLRSTFGLPYYDNTTINADFRGTAKGEAVFFNMNKFWGFRMAPFIFGDMSVITPINQSLAKSELYSAWGAGIRTRNENLIYGTIELRAYVFPRPIGYMKGYKIELSTSLRFKYNSTFIRKPDFVIPN